MGSSETEKCTTKTRKIHKKEFQSEAENGHGHQARFRKPRKTEVKAGKYTKKTRKIGKINPRSASALSYSLQFAATFAEKCVADACSWHSSGRSVQGEVAHSGPPAVLLPGQSAGKKDPDSSGDFPAPSALSAALRHDNTSSSALPGGNLGRSPSHMRLRPLDWHPTKFFSFLMPILRQLCWLQCFDHSAL